MTSSKDPKANAVKAIAVMAALLDFVPVEFTPDMMDGHGPLGINETIKTQWHGASNAFWAAMRREALSWDCNGDQLLKWVQAASASYRTASLGR